MLFDTHIKLSSRDRMVLNIIYPATLILVLIYSVDTQGLNEVMKNQDATEEHCLVESFQPRCPKNDVILMTSAIYGRMRIGRCITAEEVAAHGSAAQEDRRYFGCSADVLPMLDRKCSGKTNCDVRVYDISQQNTGPCLPGLNVYLETSYNCISAAKEDRLCIVPTSKNPTHIIGLWDVGRICGTKLQPWTVEARTGQRVSISLLDFSRSDSVESSQPCYNHGTIVDKTEKRNISICSDGTQRVKDIFQSTGNSVSIFLNQPDRKDATGEDIQFILKIEALGCSDMIPPEDSWLKRNHDAILIGCYSSRQTWHLSCQDGTWIGVFGNCSGETPIHSSVIGASEISNDEEVLVIVAVIGFTVAVCLAIICTGAVCLRRFYNQFKKQQDYNTLNHRNVSSGSQQLGRLLQSSYATQFSGIGVQQNPTYSVFGGEFVDFSETPTVM